MKADIYLFINVILLKRNNFVPAMKKINYILPLVFLIFISCAKEIKKETVMSATVPDVDFKKELHLYFKSNFKLLDSAFVGKNFELDTLYNDLDYKSVWISDSITLNANANRLLDSLVKANNYGLNPAYYQTTKLQNLKSELAKANTRKHKYEIASNIELLMTNSYMLFGRHLNHGVLDSLKGITDLPKKELKLNSTEHFLKATASKDIINELFDLQPKHKAYKKLQQRLAYYLKNKSLSTDAVKVENFRKDSVKAIQQAKKALVLHKYLDTIVSDSLYTIALKKFQKSHGLKADGLIGKNTAKMLSKSPYRHYQTLVVNLERWRWKEQLPNDYLLANIAGFNVKMFVDNKVKHRYRTVVGAYKNQTPEMRDSILSVIAHPYWYVPKKISLNEVLAKARRDSTYFKRNNFELITYKKEPVDYASLDWDEINNGKFKYLIRQGGGRGNSLGLVKFIFPNKRAIYLHDSPSKYLYARDRRAYSHGCVRVQHALKLADNILSYDNNKMTIDTVNSYIKKGKQKSIPLRNRLPVLIYYFTAVVDENDNLIVYDDVYNKDKLIIQQMQQLDKRSLAVN